MWEPDEVPSESLWNELEGILRDHPAKWMIWEGEPAQESIERLRALGVESVVVNPCANRPAGGDFMTVITENTRSLRLIFGQVSGDP